MPSRIRFLFLQMQLIYALCLSLIHISNRDLKFETDFSKKIKECMTSEGLITAKEGITLEDAKKILAKSRKEKLPIAVVLLPESVLAGFSPEIQRKFRRMDQEAQIDYDFGGEP